MKHEFEVGRPDSGRKIERVAAARLGSAPFALIRRLLRNGKIRINGKKARGGETLAEGDIVVIHHVARDARRPDASVVAYTGPPIEILHRDADHLALNKPAGVRCSMDDHPEESVQAWLRRELAEEIEAGSVRPELCHRLDRGTTGVVLVALSSSAVTRFHEASTGGRVEKIYSALAWGRVPGERWVVDRLLVRKSESRSDRPKVVPAKPGADGAQEAVTEFTALSQGDEACLLSARLQTGRTHQIRAHLRAEGLALVGDPRYGDPKRDQESGLTKILRHPALHAEWLRYPGPDGTQEIHAPRPPEFLAALRRLRLTGG